MKYIWPPGVPAKQQIYDSCAISRCQKRTEAKISLRKAGRLMRISTTSSDFPPADWKPDGDHCVSWGRTGLDDRDCDFEPLVLRGL